MEAAGQLFHLFRDGLDYAFILRTPVTQERSVLFEGHTMELESQGLRILVPAPSLQQRLSRSMSLYRADLRLALFPPLGVTNAAIRSEASPM